MPRQRGWGFFVVVVVPDSKLFWGRNPVTNTEEQESLSVWK